MANSAAAPTNGLVAYYPFNGNANDESGNSNHANVVGSIGFTTNTDSGTKTVASVSEANSHIGLPDGLLKTSDSTFAISFWVRIESIEAGGTVYLVYMNGPDTPERNIVLSLEQSGIRLGAGEKYASPNQFYGGGVDGALQLNQVHHVVVTRDAQRIFRIYVDRVEIVAVQTPDGPYWADPNYGSSVNAYIGQGGTPQYRTIAAHYLMSDLRFFNQSLSATEVAQLYAAESQTSNGDWTLLAAKGDAGAMGPQGPQGIVGPQGFRVSKVTPEQWDRRDLKDFRASRDHKVQQDLTSVDHGVLLRTTIGRMPFTMPVRLGLRNVTISM